MAPKMPCPTGNMWLVVRRPSRRCSQLGERKIVGGPRYISQTWLIKKAKAEDDWQKASEEISEGKRRHLIDVIQERGLIKDTAGDPGSLRNLILKKRVGAYAGIDPTASSLHIGHLLPLIVLMWMHFHGMPTWSVIGGATARFGDPSGRLKSRELAKNADISRNIAAVHYQIKRIWDNAKSMGEVYGYEGQWAGGTHLRNNNEWQAGLKFYDFSKQLARHMRLGPMLSRDTVKNKMENGDGMSLTELLYPLIQGWDFWELYSRNGVQVQVGGSDQFGNIVTGIECVKTVREAETMPDLRIPDVWANEPYGLTTPLLTDAKGVKYGKSEGNAVWLDVQQTSAFDLYGFFVRRSDEEVERLLKLFTFIPIADIATIMEHHKLDPTRRIAQHTLAFEVCSLVHSAPTALRERMQHQLAFSKKTTSSAPVPLTTMPTASEGVEEVPTVGEELTRDDRGDGAAEAGSFAVDGVKTMACKVQAKALNDVEGMSTDIQRARQEAIKLPYSLIQNEALNRIFFAAGLVSSTSEGHSLVRSGGLYIGAAPNNRDVLAPGSLAWSPAKALMPGQVAPYVIDGSLLILRRGKSNVRFVTVVSDQEWADMGISYPGEPYTGRVRKLRQAMRDAGELDDEGDREVAQERAASKYTRRVVNNPHIELPDSSSPPRMKEESWQRDYRRIRETEGSGMSSDRRPRAFQGNREDKGKDFESSF